MRKTLLLTPFLLFSCAPVEPPPEEEKTEEAQPAPEPETEPDAQ